MSAKASNWDEDHPKRFDAPPHWPRRRCARCGRLYGDHAWRPAPGQCPFFPAEASR